jgi:hypothetical protein
MINSKGSVIVGDQRPLDGLAGSVVVPDDSGEGEDALEDPHQYPGRGVSAVGFEVELALEGDRLDDLPERFEELGAGPSGFALAGRAEQVQAAGGEFCLEVARSSSCRR